LEVAAVTGEVQGPKRIQWRSRHIRAIGFARRLQGAHAPEGRNRPRGEAGDDVGAPVASGVPDSRLQGPNPPEETDGPSSKAADEIGGPVASGEPDSRSRSGWRHTTGPTWLLAVGLILWLISQALPATQPNGYPVALVVTLFGVLFGIGLAILAGFACGFLALVGWTARFWLLGALVARSSGKVSRAVRLSCAGLACALAEVASLYLGSRATKCCDSNGVLIIRAPDWVFVGLGAWIWVASLVLVFASTWWWARQRGESHPRAT
jgi:hypothetical protein